MLQLEIIRTKTAMPREIICDQDEEWHLVYLLSKVFAARRVLHGSRDWS